MVLFEKLGLPMEGPAEADADPASDEGSEEEAATPLQPVAPKKKQVHTGTSRLRVAAVPVAQNSPPPAPVFVARDPSLPPPERQARAAPKAPYKRKGCVHRGVDVLKETRLCDDSCPHACCLNNGFPDALLTTWRQQLRNATN